MGGLNNRTISNRQEWIADIQLTSTNQDYQLPTQGGQIPNDRFLFSLQLEFSGRLTFTGTGPNTVLADAPFSILDVVRVSGYHRPRAAREEFINMRGVDLRHWGEIYTASPLNSVPNNLQTGAVSNDIRFNIPIWFVPMALPIAHQLPYLLDAPNYDNLTLTIHFGDDFSVFTGQGAGQAQWTAFGSNSGNPKISVCGEFAMAPNQFAGFLPARTWRLFQEFTSGDIISGTSQGREYNIPRGFAVRTVLMKTGVKSDTTSSGNNAYLSVSNNILTNIKIMRGTNRMIRSFPDFHSIQQQLMQSYNLQRFPTGYAFIDFAHRGTITERMDTTSMIAGPTGDTSFYVQADVNGGNNQGQLYAVEEIRGLSATARPTMAPNAAIWRR